MPTPTPSSITITYDGDDITGSVLFVDATFESQATALPGTFQIRVRDKTRSLSFTTGREISFAIDGVTLFGGYLTQVGRTFALPVVDTQPISSVTQRIWVLRGADYNILFDRRVFYNKADPLNHPDLIPQGTTDEALIEQMCDDYLDVPADLDFTTLVDTVGIPADETDGAWVTQGSTWRDQMKDLSDLTGAIWYINGDKQLVNRALEDTEARWGFSDVPNNRVFSSGAQRFQGVTIGPRELDIVEDGTTIVNDALVWGGSMTAGEFDQGSLVFGRSQNTASIATHDRWQYAEIRPNDEFYFSEEQVQKRAEIIVSGVPGSIERGMSRGLNAPTWVVQLKWYGHDVPRLAGVPDHLRPADLVSFFFYALGTNGAPLILTLPLRSMKISFPTLSSSTGEPFVVFSGTFSLSPTDPYLLWQYLIANRNRLQKISQLSGTAATLVQSGLSPSPNGSTTVFAITGGVPYVLDSTSVFVNGLSQRIGIDYTETDPASGEITFTSAPRSGDSLWITYQPR